MASDQSGAAAIKAIGTAYGTNKTIHAYMGTTSSTKSLFYAENSDGGVMNIAGDGNVSIGTAVPDTSLTVKSNGDNIDEISLIHSGNAVKIASLGQESSHGSLILRQNGGVIGVRLSATSNNSYINSGANFGIGTTSPSAKLQVKNAISTVYANVAPSVSNSIIAISNTQTSETTNDQAQIQFGVNGGTHNRVGSIGLIAESASSRKAALVFATDDAGTRAEKMRITGDGSLGINCTPNANYKLDVNGDAARIGGNQTSTALLIEASDDSGAPSYTSIIKFKGYESRAQGIFFENNSYSGEEWFCGMNYSGSFNSWNIGYDEVGGQAEYLANTLASATLYG